MLKGDAKLLLSNRLSDRDAFFQQIQSNILPGQLLFLDNVKRLMLRKNFNMSSALTGSMGSSKNVNLFVSRFVTRQGNFLC